MQMVVLHPRHPGGSLMYTQQHKQGGQRGKWATQTDVTDHSGALRLQEVTRGEGSSVWGFSPGSAANKQITVAARW